ncbi:MAG: hypothetical protein AAEJ04_00565 [Planctomycetota bacterium]
MTIDRRNPWQLIFAILLLMASGLPAILASDVREIELPGPPAAGPGRIPRHHATLSLEQLAQQSERNPFGSTGFFLREWIEARQGALVIPPLGLPLGSRGTIRVEPTEAILAQWAATKSISNQFLDASLKNLKEIPIDGAHPLLWQPGKESEAKRALAEAVERGDRTTASILLRRSSLKESLNPEILDWIRDRPVVEPGWLPTDGIVENTAPGLTPLVITGTRDLPHLATGPDRGSFTVRQGLKTRRNPLAEIHPLIRAETALFGMGNQIAAFDLADSLQELWTWTLYPEAKKNRFPPLTGVPDIPIASGDHCVFLLRTPRHFQRPATNILIEEGPWKDKGWLEAVVLNIPNPNQPPVHTWRCPIADEGFTVAPSPQIVGDQLFLIATRGWSEVETWAFAFNISTSQPDQERELWRRKLGVEQLEAHSLNDLRDKISQSAIACRDDDLVISRSNGAIDLLAAASGEHRATLHMPHWRNKDLPAHSGIRWGNNRFMSYPTIRPRAHCSIEIPSDRSMPWLILPPAGKMLIALELDPWRIRWSRPMEREETLLGIQQGTAWILDAGVLQEDHRITLTGFDPRNSTTQYGPWKLELTGDPHSLLHKAEENQAVVPLLRGNPRIVGHQLWVPTTGGLEQFSLSDGSALGIRKWPQGSTGGTPLPLTRGRLLLTSRGDTALPGRSSVKLLETQETKSKKTTKN